METGAHDLEVVENSYVNQYYLFEENGVKGIIDQQGQIRLKAKYNELEFDGDQYFHIKMGNLYGIMDTNFLEIIKPISEERLTTAIFPIIVKKNEKFGLMNDSYKWILKPDFEFLETIYNELLMGRREEKTYLFTRDGKQKANGSLDNVQVLGEYLVVRNQDAFGLYDKFGNEKIPIQYQEIRTLKDGLVLLKNYDSWGLYSVDNKEILACKYYNIHLEDAYEGNIIVLENYKEKLLVGVVNYGGEFIIPQVYSYIELDKEYNRYKVRKGGKLGFLDLKGKIILPLENIDKRDPEELFEGQYIMVKRGDKCGYMKKDLTFLIEPQYDDIKRFGKGVAFVKKGFLWGTINEKNEEVSGFVYDSILTLFGKVYLRRYDNKKYGILYYDGTNFLDFKYDSIVPYYGFFKVMNNGKWGIVNNVGNKLTDCQYEDIFYLDNIQYYFVKENGKYGIYDQNFSLKVKPEYDKFINFSNGLFHLQKAENSYLIDTTGKMLFGLEPNTIFEFSNGVIIYSDGINVGAKTFENKEIFPCKYLLISEFTNNLAYIMQSIDRTALCNSKGEILTEFEYSLIIICDSDLIGVVQNGKYGFINREGKIVIPLDYDFAGCFEDGEALVMKYGSYFYINKENKCVRDCK